MTGYILDGGEGISLGLITLMRPCVRAPVGKLGSIEETRVTMPTRLDRARRARDGIHLHFLTEMSKR